MDIQEIKKRHNKSKTPYNNEELEQIVKSFKTRYALKCFSRKAYKQAQNNGFIDKFIPVVRYSVESCTELAKKYTTRSEFARGIPGAYDFAREHGLLKTLFPVVNHNFHDYYDKIRVIYSYEDVENKFVYVGLSKQVKQRHIQHKNLMHRSKKYDSVMSHFNSVGKPLPMYKILEENLDSDEAQKKELEWIEKYRSEGWNIINKAKTGKGSSSVGASFKWSFDSLKEIADKCKNKGDMAKRFYGPYSSALRQGFLGELFSKPMSEEEVRIQASECKSYGYFHRCRKMAFKRAEELGILEDLFPEHFKSKPHFYWKNDDNVIKAGKECSDMHEFREKYPRGYMNALERGLMFKIFQFDKTDFNEEKVRNVLLSHGCCKYAIPYLSDYEYVMARELDIIEEIYPTQKVKETTVRKIASKCKSIDEFKTKYKNAYDKACKLGIIYELFNLSPEDDRLKITELGKKYDNIADFHKNHPNEYYIAKKHGYLYEIFPQPSFIFTKEELTDWVKQFKSRKEINRHYNNTRYKQAKECGVIDIVLPLKQTEN